MNRKWKTTQHLGNLDYIFKVTLEWQGIHYVSSPATRGEKCLFLALTVSPARASADICSCTGQYCGLAMFPTHQIP